VKGTLVAINPDKPIPQDGTVDPATLDVAAKPKKKRRARNRSEPSAELKDWAKAAGARTLSRPFPPGIILEPAGFDKEHWTAPHNDPELWSLQLADAFGTRSRAVVSTFMAQLAALCCQTHWDEEAHQWRLDENELSAALAMVSTIKPRNEMEAALAAQMVSVHLMQMKCAARAIRFEYDTKTVAVAAKLARTFVMQTQALQALRGRSKTARQSIKVKKDLHQHVHYHHDGGVTGSDGQPQGRDTVSVDECSALPSTEPSGEVVPLPSGVWKARL
jgi:hypothetical protein